MGVNPMWSFVLTAVGLFGFWLAGKKVWWAWYVNMACQFIWLPYAIVTKQWPFIAGSAVYFLVFTRNAINWTQEHRRGGDMGFIKRGVGEVLPEETEQNHKTAAEKNWSEQDQKDLDAENTKADK